MTNYKEVRTTQQEVGAGARRFTFQASQLIWLLLGLLESLLALRVLLKLIAANPANPFAHALYNFTGLFLAPFVGLTAAPKADGMVLEISTFIAMVVYALLGWALERIVWVIFYRPRAAVAVTETTIDDRRAP